MTPAGAAGALVPEPVPPLAPVPAPLPLLAPLPAFAPEAPSTPAAPPAPPPQAVSNRAARNTTPLRDISAQVRALILESDLVRNSSGTLACEAASNWYGSPLVLAIRD